MLTIPRYDCHRSYQWNFDHAPDAIELEEPPVSGTWTYCGLPVKSPLAVAAGPLLNGRWCLYYAGLGFDTVTYKTVRSGARECYPLPNLQPVESMMLTGGENRVPASFKFEGSWAVSFGMPSQPPETWRADVAETRRLLPAHKLLSVSVVGTMQPSWSLERLAEDYAECARLAAESGADVIEFNLSCPNVTSCDGQLYHLADDARVVARAVRTAVGSRPIVAKIGYFRDQGGIPRVIDALADHVTSVATTNCISLQVDDIEGEPIFGGQRRGIAGRAILDASIRQTEIIANYVAHAGLDMRVIGVGGICSAADAARYLSAGAEAVQLATIAMIEPTVAMTIRKSLVWRH